MFYTAKCQYGYYCKNIRVYVDKKLKYMSYAQAGIINDNNIITLISYETEILQLKENRLYILFNPSYSRSTIKHVIAFLKEYVMSLSYYDIKQAYLNNLEFIEV